MTESTHSIDWRFPTIVTFWFFVVLDSILVWHPLGSAFRAFALISMLCASFLVGGINNRTFKKQSYSILFFGTVYTVWITQALSTTLIQALSHIIDFIPVLFVIFWPRHLLFSSYRLIRIFVIFFAVGGAIVSILTLTGVISQIPYYVLPPREALHIRQGYEYHVYGVFATLYDPFLTQAPRACGMMREPGHFAIILGFIYLIDRFRGQKINWWIILAGILTFSSNFFIIIAITEMKYLFTRKVFKNVIRFGVYGAIGFSLYLMLPSDIRERAYYLFYERNLQEVIEALNTSSSLSGGLDERASSESVSLYEHISYNEFLTGGVHFDTADSLADYRGLILQIGLIGMLLSFLTYFSTTKNTKISLRISLILIYLLVLTHRSWMLKYPYLYVLSFLAVVVYAFSQERNDSTEVVQDRRMSPPLIMFQ